LLNIRERIDVIQSLVDQDTERSLTYAALECRLTLEYLCYERFRLVHSYLSGKDLKGWKPRDVVKQVADDIDENIATWRSLSISKKPVSGASPLTREEFEAQEWVHVGDQPQLDIKRLDRLWQRVSGVALHIPVSSVCSGSIALYQDRHRVKPKVQEVVDFLEEIEGNILIGGPLGEVFGFDCFVCNLPIKRPVKQLQEPRVVNCIGPKCNESYLIKEDEDGELEVIRRVVLFSCKSCGEDLNVPTNVFQSLHFEQVLAIGCGKCAAQTKVIMRPITKVEAPDALSD